ncbi:ATP-binding protein [Singulisphaera rosea]
MASTANSPIKTIEQGRTGSSLPEFQQREIDFDCPAHGIQKSVIFRLFSDGWSEPSCGICSAEREAAEKRAEAEKSMRDADEARKRAIASSLRQAAIPPRFVGREFDSYTTTEAGAKKAHETCREYAERFPAHLTGGVSLILCGNAGTGKTHLACAIAQRVILEHAKTAVYMTVGRAFRMVKDTYRRDSERSEQEAISFFSKPDLLVLDEIGVQYGSDAEKNILFEIVNERYEALRPTILISNLALPALTEYAGERVIDRMKENGGKLVVFDWKSRRGVA